MAENKDKNETVPYTGVPHKILNKIILTKLTARERKAIDLVIRLTYGLHKKQAYLLQKDFLAAGIIETKIREVLDGLIVKRIILKNDKHYSINENTNSWNVKMVGNEILLTELISKNLRKGKVKTYQKGNFQLPEKESQNGENNSQISPKNDSERNLKENLNKGLNKNSKIYNGFESMGDIIKRSYN